MVRYFRRLRNKFLIYRHRKSVYAAIKDGLTLGRNVTIMDGVRFDPPHNALISIADNCTIAPEVMFIAHDASTFKSLNISRLGEIIIEADCFIGARTIILPGVTVGHDSIVGAGSVVAKDILAGSIVAGNPSVTIGTSQDFFTRRKQLIKSCPILKYKEFYRDVQGNLELLVKQDRSRKMFFTKGQTSNVRSAFRFNI